MSKQGKFVWTGEMMEEAILTHRTGDMGLNTASRTYDVPKATLNRTHFAVNINDIGHV
jgi:hypothetical protein